MRTQHNKAILDELALRDFGTTEIPRELRGKARSLAKTHGCTPREALNKLINAREEKRKQRIVKKRAVFPATKGKPRNNKVRKSTKRKTRLSYEDIQRDKEREDAMSHRVPGSYESSKKR